MLFFRNFPQVFFVYHEALEAIEEEEEQTLKKSVQECQGEAMLAKKTLLRPILSFNSDEGTIFMHILLNQHR